MICAGSSSGDHAEVAKLADAQDSKHWQAPVLTPLYVKTVVHAAKSAAWRAR